MKVGFITLGCDKNTVDSERYLAQLADSRRRVHGGPRRRRRDHRQHLRLHRRGEEGVDRRDRRGGRAARTTGAARPSSPSAAWSQRHKDELVEALPEVDLFLGSSEMERLVPELEERGLLGDASR